MDNLCFSEGEGREVMSQRLKEEPKTDVKCTACYDTGTIAVCGLCAEGIQHSNCDDTFTKKCSCS